jgi:hypothetical protein
MGKKNQFSRRKLWQKEAVVRKVALQKVAEGNQHLSPRIMGQILPGGQVQLVTSRVAVETMGHQEVKNGKKRDETERCEPDSVRRIEEKRR